MLRFVVGLGIVAFTTFCGNFLSRKYKKRKRFFQEASGFNEGFLEEIIYTKRPFEEFCQKRIATGDFSELLVEELTRRANRRTTPLDLSEYSFLLQDEKRFFAEYFSAFGRGDSLSQKGYFTQAGNHLHTLKQKAEEECKKYVELYTKMGFLCGLAILIILI